MTQRLLLHFSYLGTNYKGAQRLLARGSQERDLESVQGILEWGLNKLLRTEDTVVNLSSRTDTGVHAIRASAHFENRRERVNPTFLCQGLNLFLEKNQTDIRVKEAVEVSQDFHCRQNVLCRRYCYRIALLKSTDYTCLNDRRLTSALPINELYRCAPVSQPLDVAAIFDACKLFLGTWDFRTFATYNKSDKEQKEEDDFIKTVQRISFGKSTSEEISHVLDEDTRNNLDFYEFHIDGSGFLRRQVRKMVGALLGIGGGVISQNDIRFMLGNPSPTNWINKLQVVPPCGLYLKSVVYRDIPIVRV